MPSDLEAGAVSSPSGNDSRKADAQGIAPTWALVTAGGMVVLAIAAVPLFSVLVPPMGDYPNHLARLHILATIAQSTALQQLYEVRWQVTPYIGMDALGLGLAQWMPIYAVGKLLVLFVMALFLLAAVLL